jgi:hypothetical protein
MYSGEPSTMKTYYAIEELKTDLTGEDAFKLQRTHFNESLRRVVAQHMSGRFSGLVVLDIDEVTLRTYIGWTVLEPVWSSFEKIRRSSKGNMELFKETWDLAKFETYLERIQFGDLPQDRKEAFFLLLRYSFTIWTDEHLKGCLIDRGLDLEHLSRNPYFWVLALKNFITEKFGIVRGMIDLETVEYMESLGATVLFMTSRSCSKGGIDRVATHFSEIDFPGPSLLTMDMIESGDVSQISRKVVMKEIPFGRLSKGQKVDILVGKFGFDIAILVDDCSVQVKSILDFYQSTYFAIHYNLALTYKFEDYCIDLNLIRAAMNIK